MAPINNSPTPAETSFRADATMAFLQIDKQITLDN